MYREILYFILLTFAIACAKPQQNINDNQSITYLNNSIEDTSMSEEKIVKTEEEWKKLLTPEQYRITRKKGTERAFTGALYYNKEKGVYKCICCGTPLFDSETKYESGSGWPSFYAPINAKNVKATEDLSLGMIRTEVNCRKCDAHLGHVFDDGPEPTGMRYCINSASLTFEKK